MSNALIHCRRQLPATPAFRPALAVRVREDDVTPVRLHKVRQARERLATGHYDDPQVLDAAIGRLLDTYA